MVDYRKTDRMKYFIFNKLIFVIAYSYQTVLHKFKDKMFLQSKALFFLLYLYSIYVTRKIV
jgi:hypothetical protein